MLFKKMWIRLVFLGLIYSPDLLSITLSGGNEVPSPKINEAKTAALESAAKRRRHRFLFGLEFYSRSIARTTSSRSGEKDIISPLQFPISFSYGYLFSPESRLLIELDYTLLPKKGPDGGTEENHLFLRIPYVRQFNNSKLEWKSGLAMHQTIFKGQGGTTVINNGASSTTFYHPDTTITSNSILAELGLVFPTDAFDIHSSLLLESPLNNTTRNFSLLVGISYQFGAL